MELGLILYHLLAGDLKVLDFWVSSFMLRDLSIVPLSFIFCMGIFLPDFFWVWNDSAGKFSQTTNLGFYNDFIFLSVMDSIPNTVEIRIVKS